MCNTLLIIIHIVHKIQLVIYTIPEVFHITFPVSISGMAPQVLLQMDRHSDRLALLLQLLQQEARRLRALKAVAQSTGLEAQA